MSNQNSIEAPVKIDLGKLGGPTYIGRENGKKARERLKLDQYSNEQDFLIDIPVGTFNINSSYFLGLFGESIRRAGSAESFLQRFKFETHGKSYKVIERGIERALLRDDDLGIH